MFHFLPGLFGTALRKVYASGYDTPYAQLCFVLQIASSPDQEEPAFNEEEKRKNKAYNKYYSIY